MKDKNWIVSVGKDEGEVAAPDPVEAATRYLEFLTSTPDSFGVGILMKVANFDNDEEQYYIRSDVVLANAGLYAHATEMHKHYPKKLK